MNKEEPYIKEEVTETILHYNPEYGDSRTCKCGHTYERHFDGYDDHRPVGCKYCPCGEFIEGEVISQQGLVKLSRFLSKVLRHSPDVILAELDENGWIDTKELLLKWNYMIGTKKAPGTESDPPIVRMEILKRIVEENDKQRFEFDDDENITKIRARQGHSVNVDVELKEKIPPPLLYHGTSRISLDPILHKREGLTPQSRQHVHLSELFPTAQHVGARHKGETVVLIIKAEEYYRNGGKFYLSRNNVWLTDEVPLKYINFPKNAEPKINEEKW